jgi:hypothetical protein
MILTIARLCRVMNMALASGQLCSLFELYCEIEIPSEASDQLGMTLRTDNECFPSLRHEGSSLTNCNV